MVESVKELARLSLVYPQFPKGYVTRHETPIKKHIVYTFSDGSTLKRKSNRFLATDVHHSGKAKRCDIKGRVKVLSQLDPFYAVFDCYKDTFSFYKATIGLFTSDSLLLTKGRPDPDLNWLRIVADFAKENGILKPAVSVPLILGNRFIRFSVRDIRGRGYRVPDYPEYL